MCSSKSPAAHIKRLFVGLMSLFVLGQSIAFAQSLFPETAPRALYPESPLVTTAEPGETTHYEFIAETGHNYLIRVGEEAVDVEVTIRLVNGETRMYDSPLGRKDAEFVLINGAPERKVGVSITTEKSREAEVSHTVLLLDIGTEFRDQSSLVEAWQYMSTATVRYWLDWKWHETHDIAGVAADLFADAGATDQQADAILLQARALIETSFDTEDVDATLQAINDLLDKSYSLHERRGNLSKMAQVLYFVGLAHQNIAQDEKAQVAYEEALDIYREVSDWRQERYVHLNLANLKIYAGDPRSAIDALENLQRLEREYNPNPTPRDRNFRATVLDQFGAAYHKTGNIDDALWAYFEAAEIHDDVDDEHGSADSLDGITSIYLESGDLAAAQSFLDQAETAARNSSNGRTLTNLLARLGDMMYSQGNFVSAKEVQQRVLNIASDPGPIMAGRQNQLARTEIALGNFLTAKNLADDALQHARIADAPTIEADALHQSGKALLGLGDQGASIDRMKEAITIYERLGLTVELADVMHDLSVSLAEYAESEHIEKSHQAMLDEAEIWSEKSLDQIEWQLSKISDPELRGQFAASRRSYYQFHIRLLMDRYESSGRSETDFVRTALATSERARARMTMNVLNEASVELQQRVNPEVAEQMSLLLGRMKLRERQRDSLLEGGTVDETRQADLDRISREIADMRVRFDLHQVALRKNDSRYRALTAPELSSVAEIQRLIDDDSVLLQYSLANEASIVWVVDRKSINTVYLADRATIEAAAEQAISKLRTADFTQAGRREQEQALEDIHRLVLEPVLPLVGRKRLIVVGDGALHYLPFQSLMLDARSGVENDDMLREVVSLPSMSVLAVLRDRHNADRSGRAIAIFADPVFDKGDGSFNNPETVSASVRTDDGSPRDNQLGTRSADTERLPQIPGTNSEAAAIAGLLPQEDLLIETGFSVNRQAIVDRDLTAYRYLHFATHGDVSRNNPAQSSLRLSQFNEEGKEIDDELRLHDIYRLKIDADLVVLSACETGLGTDIDGEGLIGLTQGFLYAGAKSLIVSLWDVPDRPTAELMSLFYTYLFRDEMSPAAALVAAQNSLADDRRWRDPYYWGAFILLGDWQ